MHVQGNAAASCQGVHVLKAPPNGPSRLLRNSAAGPAAFVRVTRSSNRVRATQARWHTGPASCPQQRLHHRTPGPSTSIHLLHTVHTHPLQVSQWTSSCLENCIKKLTALNKPFKYVVTCVIMQKNGETWDMVGGGGRVGHASNMPRTLSGDARHHAEVS